MCMMHDSQQHSLYCLQSGACTRTFEFGRSNGKWTINGETWSTRREAASNIGTNSWEVWCLKTGGGWFHPIHLHLADYYVIHRFGEGAYQRQDEYEKMVPKDVVQLHPGSHVAVLVVFGPHRGEYMFHCEYMDACGHTVLNVMSQELNSPCKACDKAALTSLSTAFLPCCTA